MRFGDTAELSEAMGLASLRMRSLPENYPPEDRERVWLTARRRWRRSRARISSGQTSLPPGWSPATQRSRRCIFFERRSTALKTKRPKPNANIAKNSRSRRNMFPSLVALAAIELEKGDLAEAGLLARQAVAGDSKDAEAHHLLGRVCLGMAIFMRA